LIADCTVRVGELTVVSNSTVAGDRTNVGDGTTVVCKIARVSDVTFGVVGDVTITGELASIIYNTTVISYDCGDFIGTKVVDVSPFVVNDNA
jgi:hypothetical protein